MKRIASFFCMITITLMVMSAQATDLTVRVAVLDSPNMPPKLWTWMQYEKAYVRGLATAAFIAKQDHIKLVYKDFFYGNDPLDILSSIPKVKAWHPDIILGPHYSNQFLLLRNYFKHVLILSSYASDEAVYSMPKNFYSLCPPDDIVAQAVATFINKTFPKKNVLIINSSDCKDCNNTSRLFVNIYKKMNPNVSIHQNDFVGDIDGLQDSSVLLKGYQKGDVIFSVVTNLYTYINLMNQLIPIMQDTPIFVDSEDNWGNPNNGLPISPKIGNNFQAYLVNPFYFDMHSKNFRAFTENYLNLYGTYPSEVVSYVTFMTLTSATEALNNCPIKYDAHLSMKQKMLTCYLDKLKKDPHWFRPRIYATYQLEANSGELVFKQDMSEYFPKVKH